MAFNFGANSSFSAPSSGGGFAFGAPSAPSNNALTTTFGATNNNSAPSFSFGLGNTASPSTTTGGFGGFGGSTTTSSFGTPSTFGSTNAPTGGFGAGTTFGNNNTSTSTFGSNPTAFGSPSTSTFGSNFSANTNTFGSNTGSFGGGSYKVTELREATGQPLTSYHHICAMDSFKTLNADMVRWQDYKKGPAPTAPTPFGAPTTSAFGQTNPTTATPSAFTFGSTTPTAFGTPSSTATPSAFSFGGAKPNTGTPSAFSFGQTATPTPSAFGATSTGTTTFGSFGAPSTGFGTPNTSAPSTFGSFGAPTNSPSQFNFGNTANAAPANSSTFSFGNTSNNTNTAAPNSFTFGNTPTQTPSTTTSGFGTFGSQAPSTSPSSFNFGGNKPATFGQPTTNSFSFTSPTANNSAPQNSFFNGGFSGQGTPNSVNQQPKVELPMTQDPYGKLPDVSMPAARTRPLPAPVVKPATPSSASHSYKLTPKTMKKLLIMESPSSPAHIDNEQRVLNELLSPHTHVKKLVITEADQQNLSLYESNRKLQKSVLKDLSNQQKEQISFSPPPTPYQVPKKHISHASLGDRSGEKPDDRQIDAMDQNLRQSTKDSLSLSFKPTPVRVQPSGQYFHRPGIEGLADSSSMTKSRDYNSYTEAVVDNRPDIEVDKSVPVPKCTRSGVQTVPSMDFLLKMTKDELMNVNDFTVTKEDVGKVTFPGSTDVRGLDLDRIVSFKDREITLYPNDSDKPASGEGLNKPADITLFKCFPTDKKTNRPTEDPAEIDAFVKKLKKRCRRWNCRFKSYDHGNWTFTIDNFAD